MHTVKTHFLAHNFISTSQIEKIKEACSVLPRHKESFGEEEGRYSHYAIATPCKIPGYSVIHERVKRLNDKHFKLDLDFDKWYNGSYLTYEKDNFTNWHIDGAVGKEYSERKLSCVIILSDKITDYEGGDFEFPFYLNISDEERAKIKKGTAIMFPSFMFHRVTKVTKGIRNTLTFFFEGPTIR
jgi:hypothetical protein